MNFLVLSRQHHMLPFAKRLMGDGHDVETLIYNAGNRNKYEGAYGGVLEYAVESGEKKRHQKIQILKDATAKGHGIVLTDDLRAAREFRQSAYIYPALQPTNIPTSSLRMGAWFDGERFVAPHLLVVDRGVMPRGLGADCESGLTLIRLNSSHLTEMEDCAKLLGERNFRGLCQWGLEETSPGQIERDGTAAYGWPDLHTHAFVSELVDFGAILADQAEVALPKQYVVAVRLTRPPWPYPVMHSPGQHPIEGLNDQQSGSVFWHDVTVDQENRVLTTCGLDGMVGIARGAASSFELAQAQALGVAAAAQFPEKQYRTDVGGNVRQTLALLEERFGVTV